MDRILECFDYFFSLSLMYFSLPVPLYVYNARKECTGFQLTSCQFMQESIFCPQTHVLYEVQNETINVKHPNNC